MRALVRLGDTTTFGFVISATTTWSEDRRAIARTGDLATCTKCKGAFPLIGTAFDWTEDRLSFVATGDRVNCGCPDHVAYGSTTQYTRTAAVVAPASAPVRAAPVQPSNVSAPAAEPVVQAPQPVVAAPSPVAETKAQASDAELVDVVHVTGDKELHVLTAQESTALKQQIALVRKLMDEYHHMMSSAGAAIDCVSPDRETSTCPCSVCRQRMWAKKAEEAGILTCQPVAGRAETYPVTDDDLEGQLATLNQSREWYQAYRPRFLSQASLEQNWKVLRDEKIKQIDSQIHALRPRLEAQRQRHPARPDASPTSKDSATNANGAAPDLKYGRGRSTQAEAGAASRSGIRIVEVSLFSDPSRRHYIPVRYYETVTWAQKVSTRAMVGRPYNRQMASDLLKDIKEQIGQSRNASALGNLEFKLAQWTSQEDNLLNALHQEVQWTHQSDGAIPYAVSAEAHALRFAASASAGVNSWNPKEGNVNVGIKGSAALSLAEGSVSLETFFPDRGGFVAHMSYRNGEGHTVNHPIGVFRLDGKLEMSCFAGAHAYIEGSVNTQYKPVPVASGASALLSPPTMGVSRSSSVGVKAGAFVGAQAGGVLTGSLKWIEPQTDKAGQRVLKKFGEGVEGQTLVAIKVEGNVALGAGVNGECGLSIENNKLVFNCSGSLVFGPGAGGGFGTEVDLEQVGQLVGLLCDALQGTDYRLLLGVTKDAFNFLSQGLFRLATNTVNDVRQLFEDGFESMSLWWGNRNALWQETHRLSQYILERQTDKIMMVGDQSIPFGKLPPQTMGPMVYILLEGSPYAHHEALERALVILLSEIGTWRQLIEVLEHASPMGDRVNAMETLAQINTLLFPKEQKQFNDFLLRLATGRNEHNEMRPAWQVHHSEEKLEWLAKARRDNPYNGLA